MTTKPIRDMKLAVTLLALGHQVQSFSIEGKTCYLDFLAEQIQYDESSFYLRSLDTVPAEFMLSALQRFRLLLARTTGDFLLVSSREAVVSLLAGGFQALGLESVDKMLYFKFEQTPALEKYLVDLVNGKGMEIEVESFWQEYQYFSDALRSR